MNRIAIATALVALLGAGSAFAVEATQDFQPSSITSTKSRAEVQAEAAAAVRSGTLATYNEVSPAPQAASTITRAQVVAETREAARLGLLDRHDGYTPMATAAQLEQVRQAGLRAVQENVAVAR